MVAQGWRWSDVWSFFQGLGGLAVAIGAVGAGVQVLRRQFGKPALIVQYWPEADTCPPGVLKTAFEMSEAARKVLSFFVGEGDQITDRARLREAAFSDAVAHLSNSRPLFRIDALRIAIRNISSRTISRVRLSLEGGALQFITLTIDGDFLAPAQAAQFADDVRLKPDLLLPLLPDIPAEGELRLSIYGLIDPGRDLRVTTDEGLRVRTQRLVWVPRRRFFQNPVNYWT